MTSSNDLKNKVVTKIISLMSDFYVFGLEKPVVSQENWSTSIVWMLDIVGIEVEIDWRDLNIYVLIVRLENGKMPNGYYISNGKPCRYHLQKVISDRKWKIEKKYLNKISVVNKENQHRIKSTDDVMIEQFCNYKDVIELCIELLIKEEDVIF